MIIISTGLSWRYYLMVVHSFKVAGRRRKWEGFLWYVWYPCNAVTHTLLGLAPVYMCRGACTLTGGHLPRDNFIFTSPLLYPSPSVPGYLYLLCSLTANDLSVAMSWLFYKDNGQPDSSKREAWAINYGCNKVQNNNFWLSTWTSGKREWKMHFNVQSCVEEIQLP